MAKGRKPGVANLPSGVKTPGLEAEPSKDKPLSWRFSRIDFDGDWGWSKLTVAEMPALHTELAACEGQTLHSLENTQTIKGIPPEHMVREAQGRLIDLGYEDYDTIWELRLNGKRRVWGFVHDDAHFYILWWDPKETACRGMPRRQRRRRSRPSSR